MKITEHNQNIFYKIYQIFLSSSKHILTITVNNIHPKKEKPWLEKCRSDCTKIFRSCLKLEHFQSDIKLLLSDYKIICLYSFLNQCCKKTEIYLGSEWIKKCGEVNEMQQSEKISLWYQFLILYWIKATVSCGEDK